MQILSKVHAGNLVRWAKNKPEVLVFSADLTGSTEINYSESLIRTGSFLSV